jgi:emfourin
MRPRGTRSGSADWGLPFVIVVIALAAMASARCGGAMTDEKAVVTWSVSGLPPAYVEQRWRAEVPAALRPQFDAQLDRSRFFDLPAGGGSNADARDAATYVVTVAIGARTHTVTFSDAGISQELADLKNWIRENLGPLAAQER